MTEFDNLKSGQAIAYNPMENRPNHMDLQLFAEGGVAEGGTPVANVTPAPVDAPSPPQMTAEAPAGAGEPTTRQSVLEFLQAKLATPEVQPVQPETPVVNPALQVPDKFLGPDGNVNTEALLKSYTENERKLTQQGQQLSSLQQMQQQQQQIQQQAQQQEPQAPAAPEDLTPEQLAEYNENYLNDFYETPIKAVSDIVNSIIQNNVLPQLEPLQKFLNDQQETERADQQFSDVVERYPDVENLKGEMMQAYEQNKDIVMQAENPFEMLYKLAKADTAMSPEEMLQDPAFIQQASSNEQIRNAVISQYQQSLGVHKQTQMALPTVIGSRTPGGQTPNSPSAQIKSVKDAGAASKNYLARLLGSQTQ